MQLAECLRKKYQNSSNAGVSTAVPFNCVIDFGSYTAILGCCRTEVKVRGDSQLACKSCLVMRPTDSLCVVKTLAMAKQKVMLVMLTCIAQLKTPYM